MEENLEPLETQDGNRIIPVNIEEQMKTAYIDYSMSVIVGRALPDVRDGLKPVHRRILYAMNELGIHYNKPFKKSARIVGEVLGKYHPHGDGAVYDAMVRMAQEWNMRYTLIDHQGNFGNQDGDGPAAMRYTEARLQRLTEFMLGDLDKDTVDFQLNFDDSEKEPSILPTRIPQLLVNGSSGIAVGMARTLLSEKRMARPDFTAIMISDSPSVRRASNNSSPSTMVMAFTPVVRGRLKSSSSVFLIIPFRVQSTILCDFTNSSSFRSRTSSIALTLSSGGSCIRFWIALPFPVFSPSGISYTLSQ